jgi:Rrf2 family protein
MALARRYQQGPVRVREIASAGDIPEKFLELILLELKHARIVESTRGAKGGYHLRRAPSDIHISEIIRLVHGTLAPFGDSDELRSLVASDVTHRALYRVFLEVRDAAATILENITVSDPVSVQESPCSNAGHHYFKGNKGKCRSDVRPGSSQESRRR